MAQFHLPIQLRWSDLDPNFHLRHSVYYDFGAQCRMAFLTQHGLTAGVMAKHHIGPILFSESAQFKREIRFGDNLIMDLEVINLKRDYSRFGMRHRLWRGEELCAIIEVQGAWMDTQARKLASPPDVVVQMSEALQKSEDFSWQD